MLLWFALALAAPDEPAFPRAHDRVRARRYARIIGEGPAWPKTVQKSGPIEAWVFDDLIVEHYHRYERGSLVQSVQYDAHGKLWSQLDWAAGAGPVKATVEGRDVPVGGWTAWTLPGASGWGPAGAVASEGGLRWALSGSVLELKWAEAKTEAFSGAYRDTLFVGCACEPLDFRTLFVAGKPGAHYRAELLAMDQGKPAVWVTVPVGERTLFATWEGEPGASPDPLYALLATVTWLPESAK